MEKREDEDLDRTPQASGNPDALSPSGSQEPPTGGTAGTDSETDPDSPQPSSGGQPDPAAPDGESGEGGDESADGGDDGEGTPDGEEGGNPNGDEGDSGSADDPDPDREPDDTQEEKQGKFGERFLNSGSAEATPEVVKRKRESLAASLIRAALALLTGDMPEDDFIPLMDAALAREAIAEARTEGEIAGRNAVIEEQLVTPPVGAPDLGGTPIARSRRPAASIFDLADLAR